MKLRYLGGPDDQVPGSWPRADHDEDDLVLAQQKTDSSFYDAVDSAMRPAAERVRILLGSINLRAAERDTARGDLGPKFEFGRLVEHANSSLVTLTSFLIDSSLHLLPDPSLLSVENRLKNVESSIDAIVGFDPTTSGATWRESRQNLVRGFKAAVEALTESTIPAIAYLDSLERRAQFPNPASDLESLRSSLLAQLNAAEELVARAGLAASAAEKLSAGSGVSTFLQVFVDEAELQDRAASVPLRLAICCGVGVLIVGIVSLVWAANANGEWSTGQAVQLGLAKATVAGILAFGTVAFSRTYRARRHLAAVNNHRANALRVFQAFSAASAGDQNTQNAVLLAATNTIFGHLPTGFLDSGSEPDRIEVLGALRGLGVTDSRNS